jgi:hypothetical protein
MSSTLEPRLAAATAASQPACPAPTTITSYFGNMIIHYKIEFAKIGGIGDKLLINESI